MILDADEILSIILIEAGKIITEASINFQDFFYYFYLVLIKKKEIITLKKLARHTNRA